jgi:hypothetical protein
VNIDVEITENYPPTAVQDFDTTFTLSAYHSKTWTVTVDSDPEGDTPILDVDLLNSSGTSVLASNTWLTKDSSDSTHIVFSATNPTYNGAGSNVYTVRVKLYDEFNTATPNHYDITLTIRQN